MLLSVATAPGQEGGAMGLKGEREIDLAREEGAGGMPRPISLLYKKGQQSD